MKYISSHAVISKVYRDLNIKHELRFNDMIEWIHESLQLINVAQQYERKLADVEIENYKGEIPCDVHQIIMVSKDGFGMTYKPNEYYYSYQSIANEDMQQPVNYELTYDIVYPYIFTNEDDITIQLDYLAVVLDEDGYPMIPDLQPVIEAVFWYIAKQLVLGGFEFKSREIGYNYCEQQYKHYVGAAKAVMTMPSLGQMENIKNMRLKRIPMVNQYKYKFRHTHTQEQTELEGRSRLSTLIKRRF